MKQILQNLKTGQTELAEIPSPQARPGHLLIRTRNSLVSAGTERMLVDFGKANLIDKARQQPDKVRMVLQKIKTDGLMATFDTVRNKLNQPLPMGYCNVGAIMEVGSGVTGFAVGDRVVSNGHHAEAVCVPKNLCAKIPDGVSDEAAAFTVIGAIGLQGVRLVAPTLGEAIVVMGLGLIGLVTVQLLRANGCRVLGIDFDPARCELARRFGAETVDLSQGADPVSAAMVFSRGRGVDGVLITAATKSNEPVHQAAQMSRKRGRIVLVGVTGLELSRADFFEKELSFQVSCSYGPGRYDSSYEVGGHDYPLGFVRWTEQRNFEAVLDMLAAGSLNVEPLISHRFPLDQAAEAYELIGSKAPSMGVLLQYPTETQKPEETLRVSHVAVSAPLSAGPATIGFIGAGNYAGQVLIPAFKNAAATLKTVATAGGVSGFHFGRKFGFQETTTDTASLFADPAIDTLVVATRHDSHAKFVCQALKAGKNVFVEKPLAITAAELEEIRTTYEAVAAAGQAPRVMVGFNRRFSPQVQKMKQLLAPLREPKAMIMTVNAGAIPADHWTQNREIGGGRIIGEGCHFIDLLRHLAGSKCVSVHVTAASSSAGAKQEDITSFTMTFEDGSIGTVHYLANGSKAFPKERLEIFCAGRILQLDNFRTLTAFGWPGFKRMSLWRQDKGNGACAAAFVHAIRKGSPSPIPFEELVEVTELSLQIAERASGDSRG